MNSQDIRARIAQMEAEAEQQANSRGASFSDDAAGDDDLSWESLFGVFGEPGEDGFAVNDWLAEGVRGLRAAVRGMGVNDEFWGHMRGAERELLLAARVLIDTRLERLEHSNSGRDSTDRLQEIDIDF